MTVKLFYILYKVVLSEQLQFLGYRNYSNLDVYSCLLNVEMYHDNSKYNFILFSSNVSSKYSEV